MLEEPRTPKRRDSLQSRQVDGQKAHAMGSRVVCATPRRGKAVNNYSLGDRLGRGAFATVYKAIHLRTAEVAAIKQIPLDRIKSVDSIMGEIDLLQDLEHPNIVKYFGFMKDDTHLNIVLEYCENGSLAMILHKFGSFPEILVAKYMRQVLEGLEYLHQQGTIHRDIKGANILTTKDGVAKLADFGVATKINSSGSGERPGVVGTPHWMAPEIIQMQEPSPACDVWSLGATIVELRSGQPPFGTRSDIAAMYAIVQQDSLSMIPADSSASLRDFLMLCFEKDPALRVSAANLLRHIWIKKYGQGDRSNEVQDTEQAVRAWNSPSRRKKLAVPSKLNLRAKRPLPPDSPVKKIEELTDIKLFADDENYEDDFASLGLFGKASQIEMLPVKSVEVDGPLHGPQPKRKPLTAFVEQDGSVEIYDKDYEVESLRIGDPFNSSKRKNGSWNPPLHNSMGDSTNSSTNTSTSDIANLSQDSRDPFSGLNDLLDNDIDEMLINAQEEAKELVDQLTVAHRDLIFVFGRLRELVISKPQVRQTLEQLRVLPKSLSLVAGEADNTIAAFLELVEACIPVEKGSDFVTNFCIAGGLSFVLAQSQQLPSEVLRLLTKMTSVTSVEDDKISIARQLAFREDAIGVVCSFFSESCDPSDILRASSIILEMFRVCGPRHRANLWHHFNAYGLFTKLVNLLHLKFVLADESHNVLASNMYNLVVSFSRNPQELILNTVNHRILRRLMRAYIKLPITSPHRKVLLEFFKNISTLPPMLDALQEGRVAPHLIRELRLSLENASRYPLEARNAANCLVPTLFNYTRIEQSRKREMSQQGLLTVLQVCVREYPGLREFIFPIFSALAHADHADCWTALWEAKALDSFIDLITESGWQAMAIAAVTAWIEAQPKLVLPRFLPYINTLNKALSMTTGISFERILSAVMSLLDSNRYLCRHVELFELFSTLKNYLMAPHAAASSSLVQALQIISWITYESTPKAKANLMETGLMEQLIKLEGEKNIPVPCIKLIHQISKLTQ